jgi:formylglycine-generating enzyme required for sulfatase activity
MDAPCTIEGVDLEVSLVSKSSLLYPFFDFTFIFALFVLLPGCGNQKDDVFIDGGPVDLDAGWYPAWDSGPDDKFTLPLTFAVIPGGTFDMGTVGNYNESPVHAVTVSEFEIMHNEVTVSQYDECVSAGQCTTPNAVSPYCNWNTPDFENHPINCVNWFQALNFCEFIGARLPSEAEWEYAARSAGETLETKTYPWGNQLPSCDYAVMSGITSGAGCGTDRSSIVCSKEAGNTEHGLCDMAGNVSEWVQDSYHGSYDCDAYPGADNCEVGGKAPADGSAWEELGGTQRTFRGGSLGSPLTVDDLRTAARNKGLPADQFISRGMRCVRDI